MSPSPNYIALNRATFGATTEELARVERLGWSAWVEEQLKPEASVKDDAEKRIAAHKLEIDYEHEGLVAPAMMMKAEKPVMTAAEGKKAEKQKLKVKEKEKRGLTMLDKPLEQLFRAQRQDDYPYQEVERCSFEVEVATLIRACYSKWQVKELLVDFWHNHFNVNIDADDTIRAVWPAYDRDVIRRHALGNFRELLQAVAQGLPMLYYLNNRSSKASPANENYARELFELHTLGAEHYMNYLHKKWREVPGALEGKAEGFIDQDVYEAARAFTGWTAADGEYYDDNKQFPDTGGFYYHAGWHDPYQKRVLGVELQANQPPLADGMAVLDLAAFHHGTAVHLSRKLCRRFIADEPDEDLVKRVAKVWTEHAKSPDQIAHVMREILLAPEMTAGFGQKTKRPLEYLCGFIRATGADVRPDGDLVWRLGECGQRLFQWGAPTGHPDTADYWQSPNSLLKRWQLARDLATSDFGGEVGRMNLLRSTPPDKKTWQEVAEHWLDRLAPDLLDPHTREELTKWFREYEDEGKARHHEPDSEITLDESDLADHLGEFTALIAATPEYQLR